MVEYVTITRALFEKLILANAKLQSVKAGFAMKDSDWEEVAEAEKKAEEASAEVRKEMSESVRKIDKLTRDFNRSMSRLTGRAS